MHILAILLQLPVAILFMRHVGNIILYMYYKTNLWQTHNITRLTIMDFVAPAFQSWFAVEYPSCFISVMNPLYVRCFDSLWVKVLHADRTTSMCIWTKAELIVRLLQRKTCLRPPTLPPPQVIYYWQFQGDASVVDYSNWQCLSALFLSLTYCSIYLG